MTGCCVDFDRTGKYHFAGVAGVGMSSVAQAVLFQGASVSGSDRFQDSASQSQVSGAEQVLGKLQKAGVVLFPQDGSGVADGLSGLVVSTAIEDNNPDLVAAHRKGIAVLHRSEMLAGLVNGVETIAVTGTSGKSTVTGMIGWILECLGADPCVVNGAPVLNWRNDEKIGNARAGAGNLWVIEADESDRSLLNYHPDWAVVTNASKDHFDLNETLKLFADFSAQVSKGLVNAVQEPDVLAGLEVKLTASGSVFVYNGTEFALNIPGRHNAGNALLAVMMCERLGFAPEKISVALSGFKGIHRRLELVGEQWGVRVIDDYAHNPEKICATLNTVSEHWGGRKITIWRPHGFGPLASMMDELVGAFRNCCKDDDLVYLLPVYDAGGTANRRVSSQDLAERLCGAGVCSEVVRDYDSVIKALSGTLRRCDTVVTMGARDPGLPLLAQRILHEVIQSLP